MPNVLLSYSSPLYSPANDMAICTVECGSGKWTHGAFHTGGVF